LLRIAQDSYHSAAHFANRNAQERRFARGGLTTGYRAAYAGSVRFPGERRIEQMTVPFASSVSLT